MTPENYTIIAVGIALAGLILNGQRSYGCAVSVPQIDPNRSDK